MQLKLLLSSLFWHDTKWTWEYNTFTSCRLIDFVMRQPKKLILWQLINAMASFFTCLVVWIALMGTNLMKIELNCQISVTFSLINFSNYGTHSFFVSIVHKSQNLTFNAGQKNETLINTAQWTLTTLVFCRFT